MGLKLLEGNVVKGVVETGKKKLVANGDCNREIGCYDVGENFLKVVIDGYCKVTESEQESWEIHEYNHNPPNLMCPTMTRQ